MRIRFVAVVAALACLAAAGCGGGGGGEKSSGGSKPGASGVLRIGTTSAIDSLSPFNQVSIQSYNAMVMIYPQLVEYRTAADGKSLEVAGDWATSWTPSSDGRTWTFKLHTPAKWSDGMPMTASDAAWTLNETIKYQDGPTGNMAGCVNGAKSAEATDDATLVIHYDKALSNTLAALEQCFIVPQHVFEPAAGANGKGLSSFHPEHKLPIVSGGAFTVTHYEKKGTTAFKPNAAYWGSEPHASGIALSFYTNADAVVADLTAGKVDWVDALDASVVGPVKGHADLVVDSATGTRATQLIWNSSPNKKANRELLDPRVKQAISQCIDRQQIVDVVFKGYADPVDSIAGHQVGELENPDVGPLAHDCDAANAQLDQLGYERGGDGTRMAPAKGGQPAHPMRYEVITPDVAEYNIDREFAIVQAGVAELGVKLVQKPTGDAGATATALVGENCDGTKGTGFEQADIGLWHLSGFVDPDFALSTATKGQLCIWNTAGWVDAEYDRLYDQQQSTLDADERKQIVYRMQQIAYDAFPYTQLVEARALDAHAKAWTGFKPLAYGYGKEFYTSPQRAG
jgi:peptide/nickel transport system substrate-binding protein